MKRLPFILLVAMALGLACGKTAAVSPAVPTLPATSAAPGTPPPIPEEYRAMAGELSAELTHFEDTLSRQPEPGPEKALIGSELAFANGNIGEGLLQPSMRELNLLLLDRLQTLGIQAVVIAVPFPLLDPSFPRSAEYIQFYKDIVDQARQHGMKVIMKSGAIFSGTVFSSATVDWSVYTTASYLQGRENQVLLMASKFQPDYLMIANEPGTEMMLTGLSITPAQWGNFLDDTLGRIDRSGGTAVGAGVGNWEDTAFFDQVMQADGLDFFDLHIYPMGQDAVLLDRGLEYLQEAHAGGKRVTISEAWLFKVDPREGGSAYGDYASAIRRDVYGFWEGLDARFIEDIVRMSDAAQVEFVSFFWTRTFFAYLDYDATPRDLSDVEINQRINQACAVNVQSGTYSTLGEWLRKFLRARNGG